MNSKLFDETIENFYCSEVQDNVGLCVAFEWLAEDIWTKSTFVPKVLHQNDIIQQSVLECFQRRNTYNYHRVGSTAIDFFTKIITASYRFHCRFNKFAKNKIMREEPEVVKSKEKKSSWGTVRRSGWIQ